MASLKSINLRRNQFGPTGWIEIFNGIKENENCKLEEINLYDEKIGIEDLYHFCQRFCTFHLPH